MLHGMQEKQALGHTVDLSAAVFIGKSRQSPQKGHFPGGMFYRKIFFCFGGGADLLQIFRFNGIPQGGEHPVKIPLQSIGLLQGTGEGVKGIF